MKKWYQYIIIGIMIISITGCGKEEIDGFSVYTLKAKKDTPEDTKTYIIGDIRNNNESDCEVAYISLELTSGKTVKEQTLIINDTIKSGITYDVYNAIDGDYEGYKVKVKKIECYKKDATPETEENNNSSETTDPYEEYDDSDFGLFDDE